MNSKTTLYRVPAGDVEAPRLGINCRHLLVFSFLALGACHTATHRVVSPDEAAQLIAEIQAPGGPPAADPVRWVQPDNQPLPCKLYMAGENDPAERVLWDGACQDGYAYGLGREFMVRSTSGSSEWIARYHGGETPPTYYAWSLFDKQAFFFGDLDSGLAVVRQAPKSSDGYEQFLVLRDGANQYQRKRTVGSGVTETKHYYPSGIAVVSQTRSNTADAIASQSYVSKNQQIFGYGIVKPRDRSQPLLTTGISGVQPLRLPRDYVDFLTRSVSETNQQLAAIDKNAGEGFLAMLQYRAAFCVSPKSVFEEPLHYRDICEPFAELTDMLPTLAELERARNAQELSSAQAIPNPSVRVEQVQLANAPHGSYPTLSATVNRLLAQMGRAPARTYSMQQYLAIKLTPVQPAEQPYCSDPITFSPCVSAPSDTP